MNDIAQKINKSKLLWEGHITHRTNNAEEGKLLSANHELDIVTCSVCACAGRTRSQPINLHPAKSRRAVTSPSARPSRVKARRRKHFAYFKQRITYSRALWNFADPSIRPVGLRTFKFWDSPLSRRKVGIRERMPQTVQEVVSRGLRENHESDVIVATRSPFQMSFPLPLEASKRKKSPSKEKLQATFCRPETRAE
ncbi:hypothetical protein EVAR_69142_1 [Eumeta japonica]|uniref:Uncharacterized protein n=1 Tax=Eumeta variegata TaxID=151549 RepID=A0A4C2A3E3_EUMVA|nr:hypothetical protein EVAR_69142_1 [Eumeta japonica]